MANFQIFRETALPAVGSRVPYAIYLVSVSPTHLETYVTGSTAANIRRMINEADVGTLITNALASANELAIVADIDARNALTPTRNQFVYVIDATDDTTVNLGGATYLYNLSNTTWIKVNEAESLDLNIADPLWANIQNKPTSSVADIDDAVAKRHDHTNKTQLDKIGEDVNGNLTYDGALPVIEWNSINW